MTASDAHMPLSALALHALPPTKHDAPSALPSLPPSTVFLSPPIQVHLNRFLAWEKPQPKFVSYNTNFTSDFVMPEFSNGRKLRDYQQV